MVVNYSSSKIPFLFLSVFELKLVIICTILYKFILYYNIYTKYIILVYILQV